MTETETPERAKRRRPVVLPAGLLTEQQAADYLGVSLRYMKGRGDVPRVNVAAPDAKRPMWRYRLADLEAWTAKHTVNPS